FHTWNVKRLRPAEFARYDYGQENYTELLWFFEGFTSYYDDLLLRRAGLIDNAQYLKLITRTINQVLQTPGRHLQSVAQASYDAWVKYYRQDENTPNQTVSYYTKGCLVALALDLQLRREGRSTLDDVMRALWQRCQGGPMREADVLAVLQDLGGRSFAPEITQWVHGTDDLPLAELLAAHGVQAKAEPAQTAQRLGLRVQESQGITIKTVLRGSLAERAGFMAGDEWLAIELPTGAEDSQPARWRITRLDDVALYAGTALDIVAWVARDRQILALTLPWGSGLLSEAAAMVEKTDNGDAKAATSGTLAAPAPSNLGLEITDEETAGRWLAGHTGSAQAPATP
ncbi:MAG TPA: peptidase M61, partial [Delftia acidovorans]|nr:peptidase M61 [Delftia acidovorans]